MKKFLLTLLLLPSHIFCPAQLTLCSWNIQDIGHTKSDAEIGFIAATIKNFDVVAIQEVVAKDPGGAQAIARLAAALNRLGAKWEYRISDPTSSSAYKAERYAFLWQPAKARLLGKPWLEKKYHLEIDREPFFATFKVGADTFTVVNFHAITKARQPETEIKYLKHLPAGYPGLNLVFAGDFNLPQSHSVFNPLRAMGWQPAFTGQRTTLRQKCLADGCLASEFDNIFYNGRRLQATRKGIVPFYENFSNLQEAAKISDHVPVWVRLAPLATP